MCDFVTSPCGSDYCLSLGHRELVWEGRFPQPTIAGVSLSSLQNQRLCVAAVLPPAKVLCGHDPLNVPPRPLADAKANRDPIQPFPMSLQPGHQHTWRHSQDQRSFLGFGARRPSLLPASRRSLLEFQELSAGLLASLSHRCSSEEQQTKPKLFCVCKLSPETGIWQP